MIRAKRILTLVLALILVMSLFSVPATAQKSINPARDYPNVFVHGLLGYGFNDGLNDIIPYWGLTSGNLLSFLGQHGYECYAASVGPISSAWDRACELYAQLTGGTVDYGAYHSAKYDHAQHGITYKKPLFEGWSSEKKINLIGHSFGGATIRKFLDILADGSAEEVNYAAEHDLQVSSFFKGGKGNYVHSLTALAAPHNGTTFIEANDDETKVLIDLCVAISKAMGVSALKGIYDFQLEHFGITPNPNETMCDTLRRILESDFLSHNDHAWVDLTIDGAFKLNDSIEVRDNIFYFSYAGNMTNINYLTGHYVPNPRMVAILWPFSYQMGKYYNEYTSGEYNNGNRYYINRSWLPNDGMVNTNSAMYPKTYAGISNHTVIKSYNGTQLSPGTWYVMPIKQYDHADFIGGLSCPVNIRQFYLDIMSVIEDTLPNLMY